MTPRETPRRKQWETTPVYFPRTLIVKNVQSIASKGVTRATYHAGCDAWSNRGGSTCIGPLRSSTCKTLQRCRRECTNNSPFINYNAAEAPEVAQAHFIKENVCPGPPCPDTIGQYILYVNTDIHTQAAISQYM